VAGISPAGGHSRHDVASDLSFVERLCATGRDLAERRGVRRILDESTDRKRIAKEIVEVSTRARLLDARLGSDHRVEALRDGKSILGEIDRGAEERLPWQSAVPLVDFGKQRDRSGHADRLSADDRRVE